MNVPSANLGADTRVRRNSFWYSISHLRITDTPNPTGTLVSPVNRQNAYTCRVALDGKGRGDPSGVPRVITAMASKVAM
jgi:hypothetical protein